MVVLRATGDVITLNGIFRTLEEDLLSTRPGFYLMGVYVVLEEALLIGRLLSLQEDI